MWDSYRMTILQALKQFALDIPNLIVAVAAAASAWVIASATGADPDQAETVWFGLCAAGFYYHWQGIKELQADRQALSSWPETDEIDLESNADSLRQERVRLTVKGLFSAAGLISMFLPPRVVPQYEATTQVVIVLLICAVIALDIDAVLKRRSRRHQMELLRGSIERRRRRRAELEKQFQPLFERFASKMSEAGRDLAHEIKGHLSIVVGAIEIVRAGTGLSVEERELLTETDAQVDLIVAKVDELHQLVRDLDVTNREEFHDGPGDTARPIQPADQP